LSILKSDKMIQRIQSLYLFLSTILSFWFLNGLILNFENKAGTLIKITFTGVMKSTEGQGYELVERLFPLSALLILIPLLSLITILFFKKRRVQMSITRILTGLVICLLIASVYYSFKIIAEYNAIIVPGIKMVLPFLVLILVLLAQRGIRRDDELVKSFDRLR
jgi:hypothetical protein